MLDAQCAPCCAILHAPDQTGEALAVEVERQCDERGVRSRRRSFGCHPDVQLTRFQMLVIILPAYTDQLDLEHALGAPARLIADYRACWPSGADGVVSGDVDVLDAGVVQLVGEAVLVNHPTMRLAVQQTCHLHLFDLGEPFDLLAPYSKPRRAGTSPDVLAGTDIIDESRHRIWAYLKDWGVASPNQVRPLLRVIEQCRRYYEDPRRSQLYRPHPDLDLNRLDFILNGLDRHVGNKKTWDENGARVWRHVLAQLQLVEPALTRPGKPNRRGAQKDLRDLYRSLRIAAGQEPVDPAASLSA